MTDTVIKNHLPVLDHGFVRLVDVLGNDLTVVNAARVSFGKSKEVMDESDEKLIKYLASHQHYSPFRHAQLQFHCKVPEYIARQWYKHCVGAEYTVGGVTNKDHAWNEISMRYLDAGDFDYYTPSTFRQQATSNRQASLDTPVVHPELEEAYVDHTRNGFDFYNKLIKAGVAREQARGVLPLNVYTEFFWTISLQGLANFIALRQHEGAQYEIQLYAEALKELALTKYPHSLKALLTHE